MYNNQEGVSSILPIAHLLRGDHKWVKAVAGEYESHLQEVPDLCQSRTDMIVTFSVKRLIDVFLYTQYAHQPDERRERQFHECLQQVLGRRNFLTWQFLTEVWTCGLEIEIGRASCRERVCLAV